MLLRDLIERLEEIATECDDESAEVRLATQPQYPFEYTISGVELVDLNAHSQDQKEEAEAYVEDGEFEDIDTALNELFPKPHEEANVVYIAEHSQLGYLDEVAVEVLGWSRR